MKKLVLFCVAVFMFGLALPVQAQDVDYVIIVPVKVQSATSEVDKRFYYAVKSGNFQDAAFLVETRGANPNLVIDRTKAQITLHIVAGKKGGLDLAKTLIEKGADINDKDAFGETPLSYAVAAEDKELVELLLSKGADINRTNSSIFYNIKSVEMAKLLLSKGIDVNTEDTDKRTFLYVAVSKDNKDIVEFLISKGAKINTQERHGLTPLDVAKSEEVKKILIKHGAKTREQINKANEKNKPVVKQEEKPAVVDTPKVQKEALNPTDAALFDELKLIGKFMSNRNFDKVKELLDSGANVKATDADKKTPLHYAVLAVKKRVELAELMLGKGAKINAKDNEGKTPLDYAKKDDIKEYLVSKGAKSGK